MLKSFLNAISIALSITISFLKFGLNGSVIFTPSTLKFEECALHIVIFINRTMRKKKYIRFFQTI